MHTRANQLVLQLLMKQSGNLPTQYRHIEHLHEDGWCHNIDYRQTDDFVNLDNFSCLLLNRVFSCFRAYTGNSTCTRAYTEAFYYFAQSLMATIILLTNGLLISLSHFYRLCILNSSFLY